MIDGAPVYDHPIAAVLAELGICAFACTLDQSLNLIAASISCQDISQRLVVDNIITTRMVEK